MVKTREMSRTQQVQIVRQADVTSVDRLFGGRLMEWIDIVASVTARRHAGVEVTTAAVERLDFRSAAKAGNTLVLIGTVLSVGRTSMNVQVLSYCENLSGERRLINEARLIMVAVDAEGRPVPVPRLVQGA